MVFAKWEEQINESVLCFDTHDSQEIESVFVGENIIYELPIPTNNSKVFMGWYYDQELTDPVTYPVTLLSDTTIHAKWLERNIPEGKIILSTFEINDVVVRKSIRNGNPNQLNSSYIISEDGRLLERRVSMVTFKDVFVEHTLVQYGLSTDAMIIDAIIYEPIVMVKLNDNKWYAMELESSNTVMFVQKNIFYCLDGILGLDHEDEILDIINIKTFFFGFTKKNKVFVAGELKRNLEEIISRIAPLNISHQFELEEDEHFIPHSKNTDILGSSMLSLKTNKHNYVLNKLTACVMDTTFEVEDYFINIKDIDSDFTNVIGYYSVGNYTYRFTTITNSR